MCGGKRIILWSQFFPSTSMWAPDRPQTISLVGKALYLFRYLIDQKNLFLSYCNFIWYFKSSFLTHDSVNINVIYKNSSNLQNLSINKETLRGDRRGGTEVKRALVVLTEKPGSVTNTDTWWLTTAWNFSPGNPIPESLTGEWRDKSTMNKANQCYKGRSYPKKA